MNDKKNWIIIALSLVIIFLVWFIFSGNGKAQIAISEIRSQYTELVRSTSITESELDKSLRENTQLEEDNLKLETNNIELESIINNLTTGSQKTEEYLTGYGLINSDLADFIEQNKSTE